MKTKAGVIASVKSKTVMTYTQEVARVAIVKGAMAMQADAMATIALIPDGKSLEGRYCIILLLISGNCGYLNICATVSTLYLKLVE